MKKLTIYSGGCLILTLSSVVTAMVIGSGILRPQVDQKLLYVVYVAAVLTAGKLIWIAISNFKSIQFSPTGLAISAASLGLCVFLLVQTSNTARLAGLAIMQIAMQAVLSKLSRQLFADEEDIQT